MSLVLVVWFRVIHLTTEQPNIKKKNAFLISRSSVLELLSLLSIGTILHFIEGNILK